MVRGMAVEDVEKRIRLADLLADAAELEHAVLCQYLFLAFSMKRHPDEGGVTWRQLELMRRWEADLLLIARQEMEHLGLVTNLLTAIGEAPHFARPNFPIPPQDHYPLDEPISLRPFGLGPLLPLIKLEMPARVSETHRQVLAAPIPDLAQSDRRPDDTLGELYGEMRSLFQELDPAGLFIGPRSAQLTARQLMPALLIGGGAPPRAMYDVQLGAVVDLTSALAVIEQIVEEGEGTPQDRADSHFGRLVRIYAELSAELAGPDFRPARPVGPNPKTEAAGGGSNVTVITNPDTGRVAELFDLAYETMVLMLLRYFAHADESEGEIAAIQYAVFFPLMTAVIRPLGEILTQLPADDSGSGIAAGPPFDLGRRVALLPHRRAALRILDLQLRQMALQAHRLTEAQTYPEPIRERLQLVYENVARIAMTFGSSIHPERAP